MTFIQITKIKTYVKINLKIVKSFPFTNEEIHQMNIENSYELVNVKINVEDNLKVKLNCNLNKIDFTSMLSYDNTKLCINIY